MQADFPTRATALALDAADPLGALVAAFDLAPGVIYLAGNSLGPLPRAAAVDVADAVGTQWGRGLVGSWNSAGWFDLPYTMGDALAPLIGAEAGEVVMADSTGINLFRMVAAAVALRPDRRVIVMEGSNFPTNNYVVQGLARWLGQGHQIRFAEAGELATAIRDDVAVVALTHVHYRTAQILDMAGLTARAQAAGALSVWDLCHSAGAMPVALNDCNADFAVGCSYKYLNGGPGSPAFAYAARHHHAALDQPMTGWWGHRAPFAFERDYAPADGIGRLLTGTQPVLSMVGARAGLALAAQAGTAAARAKSLALGALFITLVEARLPGFALVSPRDGAARGGHVAFDHPHGLPLMKALISRGVIGDFRAPATMRFGFSPLYLRFVDVWDAVDRLADVVATGLWRAPEFQIAETVT